MYYPSLFNDDFVDDLFDDFDEMFSFPFDKPQRKQANAQGHSRRVPAVPRLGTMVTDVRELDDKYVLDMEVPGYDKKDIKVELDDGYLKVEAEKTNETSYGNTEAAGSAGTESEADGAGEGAEETAGDENASGEADAKASTEIKAKGSAKKPDGKYIRRERFYGKMVRSFYVGNDVKKEDISAAFKNGILTISIPKIEEKKEVEDKQYIAID